MRRPTRVELLGCLPGWIARTRFDGRDGMIYLSFDDGPTAAHTPRVLDLLARYDARASFFLVGQQVERHPALVERIVTAGHRLGNHSYSHTSFATLPPAAQLEEIDRTDALLARFDGAPRHWFRPPRGEAGIGLLWRLAMARRPVAFWSYDTLDYRNLAPAELLDRVLAAPPRAGDVLLLHDDSDNTLEFLDQLLATWRGGHYRLAALPEAPA